MFNFLVLFTLAGNTFAGLGPVTDLRINNADVSPDGVPRPAVLAENSVDRTIVNGYKDDTFKIKVINQLNNNAMDLATSIHWHGLFQRNTTWADGAAFVSQCPITPNNEFLYYFTAKQAGTFWYHSHFRTQYCDGLRGPLIIRDREDPHSSLYDKDGDSDATVITLSDWYHTVSTQYRDIPLADMHPDSTLINGRGRTRLKNGEVKGDLAVIMVTKDKRYRFRLLNIGCDTWYTFSIDGHTPLTVIEVDGVNHNPLEVDKIPIFAGQRYSFVLHANQTEGNYWIRAKPSDGTIDTFDDGLNMAILRYANANPEDLPQCKNESGTTPDETELTPLENIPVPPPCKNEGGITLDETKLTPLENIPVPGPVDQAINLAIDLDETDDVFTIGGATFKPPSVPVLLQILSGAVKRPEDLIPKESIYPLKPNSVIEISFPPRGEENPHPMHLHGHTFHVIRSAGSDVYNLVNPPIRDTVNAGEAPSNTSKGDNVTIRFVTDNSGPWFLHCHIDWHLERGLAVVMAEDSQHWKEYNPVPAAWKDLCPNYETTPAHKGGSFLLSFLPSFLQFSFVTMY